MGVRIQAYAVDVPAFEEFLARSVGEVLWFLVEQGSSPDDPVFLCDYEGEGYFFTVPGEGVFRVARGCKQLLTRSVLLDDACLSRNAADYLRNTESFALRSILGGLSTCPSAAFVREVTSGYRRWWIGSLLDFADRSWIVTRADYDRLVMAFQKVLRVYGCGKALRPAGFKLSDIEFRVVPAEDEGAWMGVWPEEEACFVVDCLRKILTAEPSFEAPSEVRDIFDGMAWNAYVHMMARQFLSIEEAAGFRRLAVVTFIDS